MAISEQNINMNVFLYGIEWAVLHGSTSDEQNIRTIYDAQSTYWQGGTDALLAKFPPPSESSPSPAPATDTAPLIHPTRSHPMLDVHPPPRRHALLA